MSWDAIIGPFAALSVAVSLWACAPVTSHSDSTTGSASASTYTLSTNEESSSVDGSGSIQGVPKQIDQVSSDNANAAVDVHKLAAGDTLSSDQIARSGGVGAFFFNESISDEVFARMEGRSFGEDCTVPREDLRYVRVLHVDADGATHVGELVVNRVVADEVTQIFRELYDAKYPIRKMHLVDDYGADDAASCSDDNTSAFNYRTIAGTTTLSNHARGLAIDINTFENPYYIISTGHLWPPEAGRYLDRTLDEPYVLHVGDACYEAFVSRGWTWGGDWPDTHDYQHFEKPSAME